MLAPNKLLKKMAYLLVIVLVGGNAIASAPSTLKLAKKEVRLPEGPFHVTGEFEVQLHLHTDVDATLKIAIVPEVE